MPETKRKARSRSAGRSGTKTTRPRSAPRQKAEAQERPSAGAEGNGQPRDRQAAEVESQIGVRDLTKSFGPQTVFEAVTCDVPKGRITVILGPSGTGKSVFLKHLVGLLKPDRGEIWIDGMNIPGLKEKQLYEVRRKFGVLFQDGALFGSMNVYDNVAFPLREHTKTSERDIRRIITEKLEMVGLRGAEKKLPGEISGGMKKRAGLARALVLEPQIVLFDEPDSGLDPVRTAYLSELIRDLNSKLGTSMVVVTHDIATARRVADYIGMLCRRKLIQFGAAHEMFESDIPEVKQFLAGDTHGPIGMAEEKDEEIEAKSSFGMTAEETEEMERTAGAAEDREPRPDIEEEQSPMAEEDATPEGRAPASPDGEEERKGSWLFR
jgi:phospholipid/cholesterol/gamma-HCH transport system ATP-binding protein